MNTASTSLTRAYEARIDDVSKPRRTVTAKVNTGVVDRYRTVIPPSGGDWRNFMASGPAVLWEHGHDPQRGRMPVAHCSSLKYRKADDDILSVMQFKSDPYSQLVFDNYADGTLVSFSVEFLPDESASSRPTAEELRARPDWKGADVVYRKWELTGVSAVSYPGNPEAVALAVERGLWVPAETQAWAVENNSGHDGEGESAPRSMAEGGGSQGGYTTKVKAKDDEEPDDAEPDEDEDDEDVKRYIKHEDGKWVVYSEAGKVLGKHDSKADAVAQLQAIEINKHKKSAPIAISPEDFNRTVAEIYDRLKAIEDGGRAISPEAKIIEVVAEEPQPLLENQIVHQVPIGLPTFTMQDLNRTIVESLLPITQAILANQRSANESFLRDLRDVSRGKV